MHHQDGIAQCQDGRSRKSRTEVFQESERVEEKQGNTNGDDVTL